MFVYVAVPGIALHLSSSAQGSRGSSYPPGHLGESRRLRLFLAAGMREGISASHAPQGYQQYTPPLPRAHPPHFHSPPPTPLFIQQPFQHLLSGSIIFCKMDVQHYAGVKAIFLLKWIFTHLLTWCELWSHSFVMSLESFVSCSVIGVEVHRQVVCKWNQRHGFGVAAVFTCKYHNNYVERHSAIMYNLLLRNAKKGQFSKQNIA